MQQMMTQAINAAIASGQQRPVFPFRAADVAAVFVRRNDGDEGLWFGLKDGRIFKSTGEPD